MATDSAYLALMVLTFIVPLVGYFITCLSQHQDERQSQQNQFNFNKIEGEEKRKIHPVLRQNVAIARLFARADLSRSSHPSH